MYNNMYNNNNKKYNDNDENEILDTKQNKTTQNKQTNKV